MLSFVAYSCTFQDNEIDLKLLTKGLAADPEVREVRFIIMQRGKIVMKPQNNSQEELSLYCFHVLTATTLSYSLGVGQHCLIWIMFVARPDTPWYWDTLFTEVTSELLTEWERKEQPSEEDKLPGRVMKIVNLL